MMSSNRTPCRRDLPWLALLILAATAGCPQYADPTVPNPIDQVVEPSTDTKYYIYRPSSYDGEAELPLVVLCHGTRPWDTALRQIRDWVQLAEKRDFLVVAPRLIGTRGDFPPKPDQQIKLQRQDEAAILATVRHVRGGNRVDDSRTFMSGWSAGGYAVLHTGLRHPDTFRALAVMQGNFDSNFVADAEGQIDIYQPIFVVHGTTDVLTGNQGRNCMQWLYDNDAYVVDGEVPGPHRSHPQRAYDFFEKIVRKVPWLRIRAYPVDPDHPLTVQFKIRSSFEPSGYAWDFGDGSSHSAATPEHTYAEPGAYTVTFTTRGTDDRFVRRQVTVSVPRSVADQLVY